MSWSVNFIGSPENVAKALESFNAGGDQSQVEYDAAKPHLIALVKNNFVTANHTYPQSAPTLKLTAYGSGSVAGGEQTQRSCIVNIEALSHKVV